MTVLFLGPLPEPTTGHSLACRVLLDALVERHPVEVVDLKKQEFKQGITSLSRVGEVLRMAWRTWRGSRHCGAVYLTISESIAGNFKDLLLYVACAGKLSRTLIHLHGGAGMRRIMSDEHPILRGLNGWFLRRFAGVIVLGPRHVPIYQGIVAPSRIHCVPNFAQDFLFARSGDIERKFADTSPLRILFLSNLLPGKGHEELVTAFASLEPRQRAQLSVDFAGGFESDAQQAAFLARIAPFPELRYHGTVGGETKRRLFADTHVFCLPTYYPYEGQPISILEAYAAGCSVITTDHSGIFDVFTDGENGHAVVPGSADSLAQVLSRLPAQAETLRQIAARNHATADSRYRTKIYSDRLVDIITMVHDARV